MLIHSEIHSGDQAPQDHTRDATWHFLNSLVCEILDTPLSLSTLWRGKWCQGLR